MPSRKRRKPSKSSKDGPKSAPAGGHFRGHNPRAECILGKLDKDRQSSKMLKINTGKLYNETALNS